ncbi:carboxymuconolactone decarboxylase family protein [uncultured Enterovirga sp.]|uniref:carboxymuconolactone decarboxylase family protein n=1 Tax=uncultured Enterovirga sp. TaxID=2026352 RepID=UPI0035CAFC77
MGKLPEVDLAKNPAIAASFERVKASRGWVSNLMRSLAQAPDGLQAYQSLGHYGRYGTDLTEAQRELVICATVRNVPYGWGHHAPLAIQCGLRPEQMEVLKRGEVPPGLSDADQALCRYVFAFSSMSGVPQEVTDEALRHFSPRQVTDFGLLSAFYLSAGALIIGHDVQLEPPEVCQLELNWQRKWLDEQQARA